MNDLPGPIINYIAKLTGKPWLMRLNKKFLKYIKCGITKPLFTNIYMFNPKIDLPFSKKKLMAVYTDYKPNLHISQIYPKNPIVWIYKSETLIFKGAPNGLFIYKFENGNWVVDDFFPEVKTNYLSYLGMSRKKHVFLKDHKK